LREFFPHQDLFLGKGREIFPTWWVPIERTWPRRLKILGGNIPSSLRGGKKGLKGSPPCGEFSLLLGELFFFNGGNVGEPSVKERGCLSSPSFSEKKGVSSKALGYQTVMRSTKIWGENISGGEKS